MAARHALSLLAALAVIGWLCACGNGSSAPPISVSIAPLSAQSIDQGQTINVTASVANDSSDKGVTWKPTCSASGCGTLSSQTATSAIYTAPSSVTSNLSVTIVATSIADASKSSSSTITVVPPPSVATNSLPGATGGVAYSASLQEAGGIAPFSWSVTSGALPDGLGLNNDTISGSPTRGGTFKFTMQVADSGSPPLTAAADLSITVTVLPLAISTLSLPDATIDSAYKETVQATGGIPPYAWNISGGTLPSWASLTASTGTISGIPGSAGKADFTIRVADSDPDGPVTSTQPLSITSVPGESAKNSELSGHYAFLYEGFDDATGSRVALAGSFMADGKGNITAGLEDENGPTGPVTSKPFTGTYNISSDNRGGFSLTAAGETKTFALILNSISGGIAQRVRLVEFDDTTGTGGQRGSGVLRRQDTTAFSQANLKGPYAFGFTGSDSSGNRTAFVGSFQADGTGTIPSGIGDQNSAGNLSNPSLTGSYTAPSASNGRANMTLLPSGLTTLDLTVYVVSASELLAISTDAFSTGGLLSGTVLAQASTSFDSSALKGSAVYYQTGISNGSTTSSFAEVGLLTFDGAGNASATYDQQAGTSLGQDQTFTTTYTVPANGRVALSMSPPRLLYLLDKNKGFLLDTSAYVGFGLLEAQVPAPTGGFSTASFSGTFSTATTVASVTSTPNGIGLATLDGASSFSELTDLSTVTGLFIDQSTTGTYSVDTTGRGTVTSLTVTTAGISVWFLALALAGAALHRRRQSQTQGGSRFAVFCMAIWVATVPAACPKRHVSQLAFYVISQQKAVMIQQDSYSSTPVISIVEQ